MPYMSLREHLYIRNLVAGVLIYTSIAVFTLLTLLIPLAVVIR